MSQDTFQTIDSEADFQWAFSLNRKFLEPIGMWPTDRNKSRFSILGLPLMAIIILGGYTTPTVLAFIQVRHELPLAVDCLLTSISSFTAGCKLLFLWYYRPVHFTLINWAKTDWQTRSADWERQLMLKQARRGRLITTITYITMFIHANGFLVAPVTGLRIRIVNNITDPDPTKTLPAPSYYPFSYFESPYYELAYLSQVISIPCAAAAYSAVDNYFSVLVFHASAQTQILTEKMSRLFDESGRHRLFRDRVKELIEYHDYLAGFVRAIEKSFSSLILLHIFGSMLEICSGSYVCIMALEEAPPASQIMILVLSVFNLNGHIFIYCLASEVLLTNSLQIFDGIYNCNWYDLPVKEARYVTLIMARSKYPLRLSAGKFFYLSLNSYIQMVKSTAGYISMLVTVS